ncbi:MAG: AAA family ATPase [Alcanivorax sp.]|nr:AAA family ATPase [Alcanivorax sp.]
MKDLKDLRLIIASRYPIVIIETWEEKRALDLLRRAGMQKARPVFGWNIIEGLKRLELADAEGQRHTLEPDAALGQIRSTKEPGIYALCDFHPYLENAPKVIRLLKDIALNHDAVGHTLVFISHALTIPPELSRFCARFELTMPDQDQILNIVQEEARAFARERGDRVRTGREALDKLVRNLRGLSKDDARRLARGAIIHDGAITEDDLPEVNKAKFRLLDMDGVLSFEYDTASFAQVGGLTRLKDWLSKRESVFTSAAVDGMRADTPKGILLVGVQGGGKSLAAKAVAGLWSLPLLRLDMGAVYNKYFGESERNLREALRMAETMAPCVLWLDEIEKGISGGDNDGGTSRRVLGTLLTWMAERKAPVFMVATANDIERLPPELIRKGRIDELFFVDLPPASTREEILRIHLVRREQDPAGFDLGLLAECCDGFTGAEIEQAIVAGLYSARAQGQPLTTAHLQAEIQSTVPLSITMSENLAALRAWCHGRAVPADG